MTEVWVSNIMYQDELIAWLHHDHHFNNRNLAVKISKQHELGRTIKAEEMPTAMYGMYHDKKVGNLPNVFLGNGFITVSGKCAEVINQHDLEGGGLFPVEIYEFDRVTKIAGTFFALNFGKNKKTLLPEESKNIRRFPRHDQCWELEYGLHDDFDITVSENATEGADIWVDPDLWASVFFSDRIVAALSKENLLDGVNLRKCRSA